MMAPNKLMRIFRESDEREAQQRSLSEIESLLRMTVATPVSEATLPIGSLLAAC